MELGDTSCAMLLPRWTPGVALFSMPSHVNTPVDPRILFFPLAFSHDISLWDSSQLESSSARLSKDGETEHFHVQQAQTHNTVTEAFEMGMASTQATRLPTSSGLVESAICATMPCSSKECCAGGDSPNRCGPSLREST
eukprot:1771837-Amphidinium_carterae.1